MLCDNCNDEIEEPCYCDVCYGTERTINMELKEKYEACKEYKLKCGHPGNMGFGSYCAHCENLKMKEALKKAVTDLTNWINITYVDEHQFSNVLSQIINQTRVDIENTLKEITA